MSFELKGYDRSQELVIDPVIQRGSYYGGSSDEEGMSCASDPNGDLYLAGIVVRGKLI